MLLASTAFFNCTEGTNGDVPSEITRTDIDSVVKALRGNSANSFLSGIEGENRFGTSPVRDAYFLLGHTDMIGQLDAVSGWTPKWSYPNQQSTLDAEWGSVGNIRALLSPVGSETPNGSALGATVMNNFVVAREAYAAIEQDGASASFLYRPPIFDGPLAMNVSVGYRFAEAVVLQKDAWVFNLRCTAA